VWSLLWLYYFAQCNLIAQRRNFLDVIGKIHRTYAKSTNVRTLLNTFEASMVSASIKQFDMSLHGGNSAADFARELFKPLKFSANLKVCHEKYFLILG